MDIDAFSRKFVEDFHKNEWEKLKEWCKREKGWECGINCGSSTSENWCKNHNKYSEQEVK